MATVANSKLRGGYYTPPELAAFLVGWAVQSPSDHVLEPSAGDGAFAVPVSKRLRKGGHLDAVELFDEEAAKIRDNTGRYTEVVTGDVFGWYSADRDETYDAVVGNPPFIRYQTFPEEHRTSGFLMMNAVGLTPNRLTNAWVPFVVLATRALKPGGRLAMVLPAELLQVTYAGELREYLARSYSTLRLVTFKRLVFDGIQQETVLLLGEKAKHDHDVPAAFTFDELDDADGLDDLSAPATHAVPISLDHAREKWIQYYLTPAELGLVREMEASDSFTTLGELAEVNVGIVTGRNQFFVMSPSKADELGVADQCIRMIGRSAQIPGLVLYDDDWESLAENDGLCLLMQLGRTPREDLTPQALKYVKEGERLRYHDGYKCRIRLPEWWFVPSASVPDAYLLRQIHDGPRIVLNEAGATCTDTIHRVNMIGDTDPKWLAAASMNSVTFAFSEIRGRSYGGGVLELEPTEAEGLLFPKFKTELPLGDLDVWARRKDTEQVLDEVDRLVLQDCGLTAAEIDSVRGIWRKLSQRRVNRKRKAS